MPFLQRSVHVVYQPEMLDTRKLYVKMRNSGGFDSSTQKNKEVRRVAQTMPKSCYVNNNGNI